MHAEDQQAGKESRQLRFLRRGLLIVGGAIAAVVLMSAPAWADVVDNGVAVTTTVVDSVTEVTAVARVDELPSRVLDIVPISLDTGLAMLQEFVTEPPVVSLAEVRQSDVTAPVGSRLNLNSDQTGPPASSTPVFRFITEPVPPTSTTSDVIASEVEMTVPLSSVDGGQKNDSSNVVPRRGEFNGASHAMHTTEAGQLVCCIRTSVVRVMSVLVGKQPGRTPD